MADTQSTATTYTDETATDQGESYLYQVKALRGGEKSQGSNVAWVFVPTLVTVIEPRAHAAADRDNVGSCDARRRHLRPHPDDPRCDYGRYSGDRLRDGHRKRAGVRNKT